MNESTDPKPKAPVPREMSLIGHLDELRARLIICVLALIVTVIASLFYSKPALSVLLAPLSVDDIPAAPGDRVIGLEALGGDDLFRLTWLDRADVPDASIAAVMIVRSEDGSTSRTLPLIRARSSAQMIKPFDTFLMPLKVAIVCGILLALPIVVWQVWLFVAPGLTDKEKRVVRPMLVGSIFLFPIGASFSYAMFFLIMDVMRKWAVEGVETNYNVGDYLKAMTTMMIVFGFIFELPLVIAMLARVGLVTAAFMRHYRGHIYVGLSVFSMIATPAEPISMIAALIPLIVLFEISIYVARVMEALRASEDEEWEKGSG